MGIWMSRMLSYFGEREARILVLGLDNAGKTTILCERPRRAARRLRAHPLQRGPAAASRCARPAPMPPLPLAACS